MSLKENFIANKSMLDILEFKLIMFDYLNGISEVFKRFKTITLIRI